MGSGTPEAEQEEPAPMVTHVGDPISKQEPPWESPSTQGDTEESTLRQIFMGEDDVPVEDVGWDGLRDKASKLLDIWYLLCYLVTNICSVGPRLHAEVGQGRGGQQPWSQC